MTVVTARICFSRRECLCAAAAIASAVAGGPGRPHLLLARSSSAADSRFPQLGMPGDIAREFSHHGIWPDGHLSSVGSLVPQAMRDHGHCPAKRWRCVRCCRNLEVPTLLRSHPSNSLHCRSKLSSATSTTALPSRTSLTSNRFATKASIRPWLSVGRSVYRATPPHRLIAIRIDGRQPRDERRPQQQERVLALRSTGWENLLDLVVDHIAHAARGFVVGQCEATRPGVVGVEARQGQRQQRQCVRPFRSVINEPLDQIGVDAETLTTL